MGSIYKKICIVCHKKVYWREDLDSFCCPTHGKIEESDVIRVKVQFVDLNSFLH